MKLKLQIIAFLFPLIAFGQKITISGNVSDTQDLLPGVSILEKGTSNGTSSDIDGNYSIKVNQNATLVFSFLGYKTVDLAFLLDLSSKQEFTMHRARDAACRICYLFGLPTVSQQLSPNADPTILGS